MGHSHVIVPDSPRQLGGQADGNNLAVRETNPPTEVGEQGGRLALKDRPKIVNPAILEEEVTLLRKEEGKAREVYYPLIDLGFREVRVITYGC